MSGMRLNSVACSHVGLVRKKNEDSYLDRPDLGLFVVADGMGGASSGDVASRAIVTALDRIVAPPETAAVLMTQVRDQLLIVNADLRCIAQTRGPDVTIGSTVVGLMIHSGHFACCWAGDSRLYRHRRGELDRLTRDHSLVQEMVDAGVLQPDQAERHPHASVIRRAVGVDETLELESVHAPVEPGDIFLLCSDGLTRMVSDEELEREIEAGSLESVSQRLLSLVLERGARDNVTFILVDVLDG